MKEALIEKIKSVGISYKEYYERTKKEVESADLANLADTDKSRHEDRKLNLHRMTRIEKHNVVSEELKELIKNINSPQTWMIISETWCGDSAQNIPIIVKAVESNPNITLKLVLRDSNPEIMDLYLTNGTRSIPILVAFDESGKELFRWGPRPQEAKQLVNDLIAQGVEKSIRAEKLHLWYGRNRGKNLESEFISALKLSAHNT